MSCVATSLVLMVIAFWVMGSLTVRISSRTQKRRLLMQLAKQFGGAYQPGGLLAKQLAILRYGETSAVVCEIKSRGPFPGVCFQVRIPWPHVGVNFEIISRHGKDRNREYAGVWPQIEADADLQRDFEVLSEDADEVSLLLTSGVRWQIARLAQLGGDGRLRILIRDGRIHVQKPGTSPRVDVAAQFVQGALELYDQFMLAKATGIQFLHADEAQPLDHVLCQICGEEIRDQMVFCRRCKTPHHQDCWQYTGNCSVYGCRETKYLVPEAGSSSPPLSL